MTHAEIVTDPVKSLHHRMVFDPRDWSSNETDARLYGIVVGWDPPALLGIASKHEWSQETCIRLAVLHAKFVKIIDQQNQTVRSI